MSEQTPFPRSANDSSPNETKPSEAAASKESASAGLSRRGFLKGAGITAAGTALLEGVQLFTSEVVAAARKDVREMGPDATPVTLHVNGKDHNIHVEPRTTLAEALRFHLGLTGTKVVCDRGSCSGCTVLLDRMPVNSCMMLAVDVGANDVGTRKITTIEGISRPGELHPLQTAFVKHDAMQCGFCTPGMVMSCVALLEKNPKPTEADVRQAVSGNLCRCGTYPKVFSATLEAAGTTPDSAPQST